jgi:predicted metal-binding protein
MRIFRLVDDIDKLAGAAALASQAAERFSFLSFLDKLTPKDEKTQALDAALKLVAELSAFCLINGIPGNSVADFVKAVASYEKEDAIRFAAWVTIDGVLPLGPNFMDAIADKLQQINDQELSSNTLFSKISEYLPGGSLLDKKNFILAAITQLKGTVTNFIASKGITQEAIAAKLKGFVEVSDKRLDLLAAGLDMSTNYFEHTGTQTIARQLVRRAYGEI